MEIRVKRTDFLSELAPMQGIVERKTTIPVLSHILLAARSDGLHLAATDLDVSLTSVTEGETIREGAIAVPAKKLNEIIRASAGDEIHLIEEEPLWLTIKAGQSRFKIHGKSADDFPTLPKVEGAATVEVPFVELRRMIAKVLFAVSAEESRFQLNGALLKMKPGALEMVATDGHRLALVENGDLSNTEVPGDDGGVLVPRKALQELQRFEGDGGVRFSRGEHHLSFSLGRRELICRILEGTFPDYDRVISKENDKQAFFDRRHLIEAVRRVALLAGDRARAVRLEFDTDKLTISAANPDLGEAVETLECTFQGEGLHLGMNPDYLVEFLSAVETDKVRLDLKDEDTQGVGYPVDGPDDRYLCVIMPMRI